MTPPVEWPAPFVGLPYSPVGEGPDQFHCWAFVRHVQSVVFGRALPPAPADGNFVAHAQVIADSAERARWRRMSSPIDGDIVLMGHTRTPHHVGVWARSDGGGVLHCLDPLGVVFQSRARLAIEHWRIEGFYRFVGGAA